MSLISWVAVSDPICGFDRLDITNAVIAIDGNEITKSNVVDDAAIFTSLMMNKKKRSKLNGSDQKYYREQCERSINDAIARQTVQKYASEHGVAVSTDALDRCRRKFVRKYTAKSKKLKREYNIDDLKYILGNRASRIDAEINSMALYQCVTNHILLNNPGDFSESAVREYISEVKSRNDLASATNAYQFVKSTNVWKQVLAKECTFEEAATNNSEDIYIDSGCEWGTFSLDQLADDPQVIALIPSMKIGAITPPVESDQGIAILRLDEIDENKKYTLSRIYFRLAYEFEIPTPEIAERQLRESYQDKKVKEILDGTRKTLNIQYPAGTNLFAKGTAPLKIIIPKFR